MAFPIRSYARALFQSSEGKSKAETEQLVESVVKILAEKNALSQAPALISEIERLDDENEGILRAQITSAHRLDEATIKKFEQVLRTRTEAKEIIWEKEIDPALLGGAIIRYRDIVLDMSLAMTLESLAEEIKK